MEEASAKKSFMGRIRVAGITIAIARALNAGDIRTPQGCRWYPNTVRAALLRKLAYERIHAFRRPASVPPTESRARRVGLETEWWASALF
jgi:hypothetical protein